MHSAQPQLFPNLAARMGAFPHFPGGSRWLAVPVAIGLGLSAAALVAQMEGERGVPPIASSGDYEVGDIRVDAYAENAEAARLVGWRQAQRLAWRKLSASMRGGAVSLSDSQLDQMVSGIEVEKEEIGPRRYVATVRVLFDRARAGQILGVRGAVPRSAPLLVIPVLREGGVSTTFESINEWQKAWARYRVGDSLIDYVRVSGTGPDALLLNAGQVDRRGRLWWRNILDQYGAADIVFPIARLERQGPGGPVIGHFTARHGPDNHLLGSFSLRASNAAAIPAMMDEAIRRINDIYSRSLMDGRLRPDSSLVIEEPVIVNELELENSMDVPVETLDAPAEAPAATAAASSYSIHFETPDAASVNNGEAQVRSIAGVKSANTSSLALGGISVMQVSHEGGADALKAALQAKGYQVSGSGSTLRITRRGSQ